MSFDAIIYFNGPKSLWVRSGKLAMGVPVDGIPEPDPSEVIARKTFRRRWLAEFWVGKRMSGLSNLSFEIRPK